jgi:hypothetical protein
MMRHLRPQNAIDALEDAKLETCKFTVTSTIITEELTEDQAKEFAEQLEKYTPQVYAFVPYQGSVWGELNKINRYS